jgi:hypothetical protein
LGQNEDLEEKKLLGSGGYVLAKLTEQEELRARLGVPQIFLANIERLNKDRFTRYFCKKCNREYNGCPNITYTNPNEELGNDIILIEKGEYQCKICNNIIAIYRKFNR